jgi:transposase
MFDMLNLLSILSFSSTTTMRPTFSIQRSIVISYLQEGYSLRQIQSKTSIGKSTISRIKKAVDMDKENPRTGQPSKLSSRDKQAIIRQITSGKLDNAVQATHFINNIIPHPVSVQTVRNTLKEHNFRIVVKQKRPMLKAEHRAARLKFARTHLNWTVEDWKRIL